MWNNGKKCAVALTFDFDAETMWTSVNLTTPTYLSRGEYEARVGIPRILSLLSKYNIEATFFVPGATAERYTNEVKEIVAKGHEVAHHGYAHEITTRLPLEEEKRILEKGFESLEKVTGKRPKGYRSPAWDLSPNSISLYQKYGFLYDSSLMADDFKPYFLKLDGNETNIVELPVAWELDDASHFLFNFFPYFVGLSAPSKVYDIWATEFEGAYENEGIFILTMHPQIIGRYYRIQMLEKLIRHIIGYPDTWFATCTDIAKEWLIHNQV